MSESPKDVLARDAVVALKRPGSRSPDSLPVLRSVPGELARFLEVAETGYAICICNAPAERKKVLSDIAERLATANVGVFELELEPGTRSITRAIREAMTGSGFIALEKRHTRVVLSVNNLTDAVLPAEREADRRPVPLQGMNQQRDWLRKLGRPVLFWMSEWLAGRLARWAPDFWVGRSVTFMFLSEDEHSWRAGHEDLGSTGPWYPGFASLDEAQRKIRIYEDLLQTARSDRDRAIYLGSLGSIHVQLGELDRALEYQERSLALERELGNKQGEAQSLGNIGSSWLLKGELNRALEYLEMALAIDRELGNRQGLAIRLANIAVILKIRGELGRALEYLQEALKIGEEMGDKAGVAARIGNIGSVWLLKGELDRALKYLEMAMNMLVELGAKQEQASVLGNIGLVWQARGEPDKALGYLLRALAISERVGARLELEKVRHSIARVYHIMPGKRFIELCVEAGIGKEVVEGLVRRFEEEKQTRPGEQ